MESLKKTLIRIYSAIPFMDKLKDQKLIIITHAGIITGIPIAKDECNEIDNEMASMSLMCIEGYRKEHSIDESQPIDGNDGFISLKDVDFKSGALTCHFNILNVFFDQIVGITIGNNE
ncbi:MAG: hypothetical protein HDR28_06010 [Lachnospiraceae bacterium]|nr:hypothetical protein [Lachnospiraceae bacterium]